MDPHESAPKHYLERFIHFCTARPSTHGPRDIIGNRPYLCTVMLSTNYSFKTKVSVVTVAEA